MNRQQVSLAHWGVFWATRQPTAYGWTLTGINERGEWHQEYVSSTHVTYAPLMPHDDCDYSAFQTYTRIQVKP